jgi:hypothetical protein
VRVCGSCFLLGSVYGWLFGVDMSCFRCGCGSSCLVGHCRTCVCVCVCVCVWCVCVCVCGVCVCVCIVWCVCVCVWCGVCVCVCVCILVFCDSYLHPTRVCLEPTNIKTAQHISGILMPIIRSLSTAAEASGLP